MPSWITIQNLTRPDIHPIKACHCTSFSSKLRGLMFKASLNENEGILIDENKDGIVSAAIHMFFMCFPIAVIWIDSNYTVVDSKIAHPWRPFYAPCKPARYVLEAHPKRILDFQLGDRVKLRHE